MTTQLRTWRFRTHEFRLGDFPLLMGIVNVTPDSFSDGGEFLDPDAAVRHALQLVEDGADILDVGGESTRPGAEPVSVEEELRRVVPVVRGMAEGLSRKQRNVLISIDTMKAEVARQAVEAGAAIVNDVSGLTFDPGMPAVCRETGVGVVCMHMRGTPQTMQDDPQYDDVVTDICEFFRERLAALQAAGIPPERIVLDPGIGFGKTAAHNLQILSGIARFRALGRPVLIGHSRKRFLSRILGRDVEERTFATVGVSLALAAQHADVLRLHDVRATRDALVAFRTVVSGEW